MWNFFSRVNGAYLHWQRTLTRQIHSTLVAIRILNKVEQLNTTSQWKTDFSKHSVPLDELISGGVGRDGIPPIDNPTFVSIEEASSWLLPQSPVVTFEENDDARAYPLGILTQHEIVNDVVGGTPVAVTFCPLCNSSIVFDRRVDDEPLRFGVSGLLRHSDLVMWDDKTESLWQQFTGQGIVGEHTGRQLNFLPSLVTGFKDFTQRHPKGQVLDRDRGIFDSSADRNPYVNYDSDPAPFLFKGQADTRLFPTSRVLAAEIDGQAIAYPFEIMAEKSIINDRVGNRHLLAIWQAGVASALDKSDIDVSRDVGMAALYNRSLDGQTLSFTVEDGLVRDEQTNSSWNIFGQAVDGKLVDRQLEQELAHPHFWFAWAAFNPKTLIYDGTAG